eukprot:jgi/Tetstr1/454813/TSEL_041693.t1
MSQELGLALDGPTPIGEDNQACIAIATNDVTSSRTKHMDIRYHFVREACKNGDISIHYVETREMAADMFTKPLRNPLFAKFAAKGHIFPWRCRISASPTRISAYGGKSSSLSPIKLRKKHSKKCAFGCRWWESQGHIFTWRCRISASPTRISA